MGMYNSVSCARTTDKVARLGLMVSFAVAVGCGGPRAELVVAPHLDGTAQLSAARFADGQVRKAMTESPTWARFREIAVAGGCQVQLRLASERHTTGPEAKSFKTYQAGYTTVVLEVRDGDKLLYRFTQLAELPAEVTVRSGSSAQEKAFSVAEDETLPVVLGRVDEAGVAALGGCPGQAAEMLGALGQVQAEFPTIAGVAVLKLAGSPAAETVTTYIADELRTDAHSTFYRQLGKSPELTAANLRLVRRAATADVDKAIDVARAVFAEPAQNGFAEVDATLRAEIVSTLLELASETSSDRSAAAIVETVTSFEAEILAQQLTTLHTLMTKEAVAREAPVANSLGFGGPEKVPGQDRAAAAAMALISAGPAGRALVVQAIRSESTSAHVLAGIDSALTRQDSPQRTAFLNELIDICRTAPEGECGRILHALRPTDFDRKARLKNRQPSKWDLLVNRNSTLLEIIDRVWQGGAATDIAEAANILRVLDRKDPRLAELGQP